MSDLSVFPKKNLTSHGVGSFRVEMAVICSLRPHKGWIITRVLRGINEVKRIWGSGSDTDKDNFDELLLFFFLIIISFTFSFLTNSDHFHDWHCVISGILSFIFPCILSQEFTRSLHFYSTNTGRKVRTENTFLSILPSTDFILYF